MVLAVLLNALGLVLIFLALHDIFHQLFHPDGSGRLTTLLVRTVWSTFRRAARWYPGFLGLAAPSAVVVIIAGWAALLTVGWALLYWPYMPENFLYSTGLAPSVNDGFIDALYVSLTNLTTLGYGDMTPTGSFLRMMAPLQALIGFVLLTASITWMLSIYPALSRSRTLAQEISLIHDAELAVGGNITKMKADSIETLLQGLASQLVSVRNDLMQFSITYYFHSSDDRSGIATTLPYLAHLAEKSRNSDQPEVRMSAEVLEGAIENLATTIATDFLRISPSSTQESLEAFARDHLRTPLSRKTTDNLSEDE